MVKNVINLETIPWDVNENMLIKTLNETKNVGLKLEKATSNKLIADCFEMSKKHISGMIWSNYDKGFKK